MDSNTDDRDPEVPPDIQPDELQEALRWLDELTGGKSAGPEAGQTAADSPFHGLVDDGAGDLPDWLREASKAPVEPRLTDDGEFESRLDWLAKMAERESIEELPTLEWRNLSGATAPPVEGDAGPLPDDTIPPTFPADLLPVEATPAEPLAAETVLQLPPAVRDEEPAPDVEPEPEAPVAPPPDLELEPAALLPSTPITPEALLDSLPPDVELPPIDDLDAAMAWIEELAASQDAPIEDVPSVADRALASKLMMEAGLSPDGLDLRPGDELGLGDLSLLEGNTPVNAFVAAEDFADTIVLVETMAADQGRTLEAPPELPARQAPPPAEASFDEAMAFLDEMVADQEPLGALTQPLEPIAEEAAAAYEAPLAGEESAAMWLVETETVAEVAWLTEAEPVEAEIAAEVEAAQAAEVAMVVEESDEALSPADAPWLIAAAAEMADEWNEAPVDRVAPGEEMAQSEALTPASAVAAANGNVAATLEETLRAVDALALPPGQSLAEYNTSLRQSGAQPARRDLPAAVEWLELALGISVPTTPPAPQWSDDELISQMPEDPDAVLAWLEQLAEEDTIDSSPRLSPAAETLPDGGNAPVVAATVALTERAAGATEPTVDELSAADLANMPEDPDAVMAWLEGLAGGGKAETVAPPIAPLPDAPAAPAVAEQPTPVTSSRSRRRRGRKSQPSAAPVAVEAAVEPAVTEVSEASAWPATEVVAVPDVTAETSEQSAPPIEVADVTPAIEIEEVALANTPVEEALSAPSLPEPTGEATTEPAESLPPPAGPRRRGRKPKAAATAAVEPAEVVSMAVEEAADAVEATAEQAADALSPEIEEAPPTPAKPASWVDLLKPLK